MTPKEYEVLVSGIANEFTNNPNETIKWEVSTGKSNRIEGASGFKHQIDVSLMSDEKLLIVECKKWTRRIQVGEYLTLLGRLIDISAKFKDKSVRAALVTTIGWQSGVMKLNSAYGNKISLFQVDSSTKVGQKIHTAFVFGHADGSSITSASIVKQ